MTVNTTVNTAKTTTECTREREPATSSRVSSGDETPSSTNNTEESHLESALEQLIDFQKSLGILHVSDEHKAIACSLLRSGYPVQLFKDCFLAVLHCKRQICKSWKSVAARVPEYAATGKLACCEDQRQSEQRKRLKEIPAVVEIFEYWQEICCHSDAELDDKRAEAIYKQLESGRSVKDIRLAIRGASLDSFTQGDNDRGRRYDDISLICRDAEHIERFMEIAARAEDLEL